MKKFAANYLVSKTDVFLKNGIVSAEEDGAAVEYLDTNGDLREIAQLIFYNGILMGGSLFVRTRTIPFFEPDDSLRSLVYQSIEGLDQVSIYQLIDLGKEIQKQFPEMKIPEIWKDTKEILLENGYFAQATIPGIFLLSGSDLVALKFTSKSRLKKIL